MGQTLLIKICIGHIDTVKEWMILLSINIFLVCMTAYITERTCRNKRYIVFLYKIFRKMEYGDWIEKLIDEQKENEFLYKILYAAYNRNKDELRRRSSFFKKIKEM